MVERALGEGGMGIVYRAHDEVLDRTVALKLLSARLASDEQERLRREATALARLSHPSVIAIYDVGSFEGEPYIAMEHVPGVTLRAWLQQHRDASWREIAGLFLQAAHGLAAAHRAGLVHRDFKPDNVLVDPASRVRIADFGLARVEGAVEPDLDGSGEGSPELIAPEQRAGRPADARSDQYSFCLALLHALDAGGDHPRREGVPPTLRAALTRGLRPDPAARHASMEDLVAALEASLSVRPADRARGVLLDRVERFWTAGVLTASLGGADPLDVPLGDVSDRVDSPLPASMTRHDERIGCRDLPTLLRRANDSLLILGAPGAGKTTALLMLVRELVAAARADPTQPVPVVLNLTAFSDFEGSLGDWITDELVTKYSMARRRSRAWLDQDELVLVLDGLDELPVQRRRPCVEAINAFRHDHPVPMVVASREDAYARIQVPLQLGGAVRVEALDDLAIDAFLERRGESGRRIQQLVAQDAELRQHLRSPLMLTLAAVSGPDALEQAHDVRGALLDAYVDHMFAQRPGEDREAIVGGLRWLASTMRRLGRSDVWVERIQSEWLDRSWARPVGIAAGLAGVVAVALLINAMMTAAASAFAPPYRHTLGLAFGALAWVLPYVHTLRVRPIEQLTWSFRRGLIRTSLGLVLVIPVAMLVMSAGWIPVLLAGVTGGAVGLLYGLEPSDVPNRVRPNQGIRQSARNAVVVGLIAGLGSLALMGFFVMPAFEATVGRAAIVEAGANPGFAAAFETAGCVGTAFAMIFGGYAVMMHSGLRVMLAATTPLPLRLIPFLDRAVDLGLLRRVGGGYIFLHRTVLDHFDDGA